jgi:hypothetical protein
MESTVFSFDKLVFEDTSYSRFCSPYSAVAVTHARVEGPYPDGRMSIVPNYPSDTRNNLLYAAFMTEVYCPSGVNMWKISEHAQRQLLHQPVPLDLAAAGERFRETDGLTDEECDEIDRAFSTIETPGIHLAAEQLIVIGGLAVICYDALQASLRPATPIADELLQTG